MIDLQTEGLSDSLAGCRKIESLQQLHRLELPAPRGIAIPSKSRENVAAARKWLIEHAWSEALVRTDHPEETAKAPAGGYVIPISRLEETVENVVRDGRVLILLEPHDKYDNLRGLNIELDMPNDRATIETVGAGFDVSDINRLGLVHERLQFDMTEDGSLGRMVHREIVPFEQHDELRRLRLVKIASELCAQGFIPPSAKGDADAATAWLKGTGRTRLFNGAYEPLAPLVPRIRKDMEGLGHIVADQHRCRIACFPASVFPDNPDSVFYWDIIDPGRKWMPS